MNRFERLREDLRRIKGRLREQRWISVEPDEAWERLFKEYRPEFDATDIYELERRRYRQILDKFFKEYYEDGDYSKEEIAVLYDRAERMIQKKIMQYVIEIAEEELRD